MMAMSMQYNRLTNINVNIYYAMIKCLNVKANSSSWAYSIGPVFHLAISNMAQRHVAFCERHVALHVRHVALLIFRQ